MYKVKEMKSELITVKQASEILGVNPETLRRWDRAGKLKAKRHPMNSYRLYKLTDIRKLKIKIES